ncbi:hypothetical protein Ancab_039641 [Ancistrocladus abbreviatus]
MKQKHKDKVQPTRVELYLEVFKKNDGTYEDGETSCRMKEKLREYEMMVSRSESVAWEGDSYSQVMGKDNDGYVHRLGLCPTPKEVWGLASLSKWKGIRLTTSNKETTGVKELCNRMDTGKTRVEETRIFELVAAYYQFALNSCFCFTLHFD